MAEINRISKDYVYKVVEERPASDAFTDVLTPGDVALLNGSSVTITATTSSAIINAIFTQRHGSITTYWTRLPNTTDPATNEILEYSAAVLARGFTPGGTVKSNRPDGWDAGGSSIDTLTGDGYIEFLASPAPGRIAAGLTYLGWENFYRQDDPAFGFYIRKDANGLGRIRIQEKGTENTIKYVLGATQPTVKASANPRYRIIRRSGVITYVLLNTAGTTVLYQQKGYYLSTLEVRLDASLYRSGDYIEEPALVTPDSDFAAWTNAVIQIGGGVIVGSTAPDGLLISSGNVISGATNPDSLSMEGRDLSAIIGATAADTVLIKDTGVAYIVMGTSPDTMVMYDWWAFNSLELSFSSGLGFSSTLYPEAVFYDVLASGLNLRQVVGNIGEFGYYDVTGTVLYGAQFSASLGLDDSYTHSEILNALLRSALSILFTLKAKELDALDVQYGVNASTGALTTYRNFGFTSFANAGVYTYATRPDGIYRLRAGDDAGALRDYLVDFGKTDFESNLGKTVDSVYFGLSTDGERAYAKVTTDNGDETVYDVTQYQPTARAVLGRGAVGKEWGLKLLVTDASEFELDNIEYSVGVTSRRRVP